MTVTQTEITRRFSYHAPTPQAVEKLRAIRNCGKLLGEMIVELCPAAPETSLAIRKLEETVMWANASIVRPMAPEPSPEHGPGPGESHLRRVS